MLVLTKQRGLEKIYPSVFDFSGNGQSKAPAVILRRLAHKGKGNCAIILPDNSDYKLVKEVQAKRVK